MVTIEQQKAAGARKKIKALRYIPFTYWKRWVIMPIDYVYHRIRTFTQLGMYIIETL